MVGVGDWPDVDTLGRERGIGTAGERDDFMLVGFEDCGEDDGTEATGSSSDGNFDNIQQGRVSEAAQRYHTPIYILDRVLRHLLCNPLMRSTASIAPHASCIRRQKEDNSCHSLTHFAFRKVRGSRKAIQVVHS